MYESLSRLRNIPSSCHVLSTPGQHCGGRVVVVGMVSSKLQLCDCIHPEVVVPKATTLHTAPAPSLLTASVYHFFDTGLK